MSLIGLAAATVPPCIISMSWSVIRHRRALTGNPNSLLRFLAGIIVLFGRDERSRVKRAEELMQLLCGADTPPG